ARLQSPRDRKAEIGDPERRLRDQRAKDQAAADEQAGATIDGRKAAPTQPQQNAGAGSEQVMDDRDRQVREHQREIGVYVQRKGRSRSYSTPNAAPIPAPGSPGR